MVGACRLAWRFAASLALAAGCYSGSGGPDGGGSATAAACSRAASHLRGCGVLTDGKDGCVSSGDALDQSCIFDCFTLASCDALETAVCAGGDITDPPAVSDCVQACALASAFRCLDGRDTVPSSFECDGEEDCLDGSDEARCEGRLFECRDGSDTLPADFECDGFEDCLDSSDERGCPDDVRFACASSGETIAAVWQCDGLEDCVDGSDETDCPPLAEVVCPADPTR